jgi:K+-sensing histidine kinase KdpD
MMPSRVAAFRSPAAQCFYGIIALAVVTFVCFRLKADLATTAFIYLAIVVLLSLIGSYVASVVLILVAVAGLAYFFNPPVFGSATDLPQDIALVIVFLLTPLTVTDLVRRARKLTKTALESEVAAKQAERELRLAINTIPALTAPWILSTSVGGKSASP